MDVDTRPTPPSKRALDVVLAAAGLLLSAPLWPLVAAAVKLEDGGPVLYREERVGKGLAVFRVVKFRTMRTGSDVRPGFGSPPERAVTRVGRLLRATALDELPQLVNILRGEMSFVGPRPLARAQVEADDPNVREEPGFRQRHAVLPGLTGLAQLRAPRPHTFRQKFRWDRVYVERRSLALDLRLVARSVGVSLRAAWPGADGEAGGR